MATQRNPNEPGKSGGPGQQGGQEGGSRRDRNVNASSASARSRAATANPVAVNKAAVSKADDKADCPCITGAEAFFRRLLYQRYLQKDSNSVSALSL
jgi:hypothetical protein